MSLITDLLATLKPPPTSTNAVDPFEGKPLTEILAHGHEIEITPALALRILNECAYKYERRIREDHIAAHVTRLRAGTFWRGRQISFALFNGKLVCTNGHHRLIACVKAGKSIFVMIEVVHVDSEKMIHNIYGSHDSGAIRTPGDTSGELRTSRLSTMQVGALMRACVLLHTGFRKPDKERDAYVLLDRVARRNIALKWTGTAEAFFDATGSAPTRVKVMLLREPVFAVALRILRDQPEKATEFWQGLAEDDGLKAGDPRKALLNALAGHHNDKTITPQLFLVARAWNAFFNGKLVKRLFVPTDRKFWIAGTDINEREIDAGNNNSD